MQRRLYLMAVTLTDVARAANVSTHSASGVLNGKAERYRISQATQERIKKVALELGYDPANSHNARQMAARKHGIKIPNNVIAVCTVNSPPLHQQPFHSEVLDGIEIEADKQGMDVLQCRLRPERLPRLIERGEVDGIIALSARMDQIHTFQQIGLPIIKIGSASPGCHSVSAAHFKGVSLATSHLIDLGHKNIAFIGRDLTPTATKSALLDATKQRFDGYLDAMKKANLPVEYEEFSIEDYNPGDGANTFRELWKVAAGKITAVVCYNDTLAMGVIQAAMALGLHVPRDLSVVGFDAVSTNFSFEPIISSVEYDRELMGKRAVEILMQSRNTTGQASGEREQEAKFIHEELPVHFVEGATTAPVRNMS
jgi:DNA-binding LacI/PurR family transcriptional regulator